MVEGGKLEQMSLSKTMLETLKQKGPGRVYLRAITATPPPFFFKNSLYGNFSTVLQKIRILRNIRACCEQDTLTLIQPHFTSVLIISFS